MSNELVIKKEGSYGLVDQFRKMAHRVILPELKLSAVKIGEKTVWQFSLRNPWYTSIPVSTVTSIDLSINGYAVAEKDVEFVIREQAIPFPYARNLYEMIWGFGECVYIRIIDPKIAEVLQKKNKIAFDLMVRTAFEGYHLPNNRIDYPFEVEMEANV